MHDNLLALRFQGRVDESSQSGLIQIGIKTYLYKISPLIYLNYPHLLEKISYLIHLAIVYLVTGVLAGF
jgi:hypothetical protein